MMVSPELVTVVPPNTAKVAAVPSVGAVPEPSGRIDPLRAATLNDRPANEREITRMIEIN